MRCQGLIAPGMVPSEPNESEITRWQEWLSRPAGPEGPYDLVPGHTYAETLSLVGERMTQLFKEFQRFNTDHQTRISPEGLERWHGRLFGAWFQDAGRFRKPWEQAEFSVAVFVSEHGAISKLPARGIAGDE